ncbi:MAG: glycosyltransferase [Thermodesulfobacteriota bacterium]
MKKGQTPHVSVIITTIGGYESVRTTIEHLNKQTVRERLEVIVITPPPKWPDAVRKEFKLFYNCSLIEADIDNELYKAWASAVHQSSAPVVAFGENHAFPEPKWAEPLIEAHKGPWAGVGCVFKNANPDGIKSRAQMYMTYGRYTETVESGETDDLPGHNTSYKRPILLDYGSELKYMLTRTDIMHMDLRSRGHRLYIEIKAGFRYINVSKTLSILLDLFYNGQLYTADLVNYKKWSPMQRFVHALLEPMIKLKHFKGTLESIRRAGEWNRLVPSALPIILFGHTAHFFGKVRGYFTGSSDIRRKINSYELEKFKYITEQDIKHVSNL